MKYVLLFAAFMSSVLNVGAVDYSLMKNEIGFDGGSVDGVADSDFEGVLEDATVFGAHYVHFISPRIGLGVQMDVLNIKETNVTSFYGASDGVGGSIATYITNTSSYENLSAMALLRLNVFKAGIAMPYLIGGIGANRFQAETAGSVTANHYNSIFDINSSNTTSSELSDSSIGLAFAVGAGLDMMMSEVCRIGVEGRYNLYQQSVFDTLDDIEMTMLKGRISWYFN